MSEARPPLPPFTEETAIQKIRAAEDQRFPTPCGPSTDQGDELPRAWEVLSDRPLASGGAAQRSYRLTAVDRR